MHKRVTGAAWIITMLASAASVWSEDQIEEQKPLPPSHRVISTEGAIEDLAFEEGDVLPVNHCTDCTFSDTVSEYDDTCATCTTGPLAKFKAHCGHGGKCGSGHCHGGNCGGGHCGGGHRLFHGIGACLANCGLGSSECDDYECANCYSRWDVEKRLYIGYVAGSALKASTRIAVNDFDGVHVGAEFLPWTCTDGDFYFSRAGFTVMWQYSKFYGGSFEGQLRSNLTGGFVGVDSGQMHSLIIGPTYRIDFEILRMRLSPNLTTGLTFDWVDLEPTPFSGGRTIRIERFKFTGFDVGAYTKLALDFGITEKINFSIGMDFRASDTDVMQDDGDLRKHMGLVIGMSHTF